MKLIKTIQNQEMRALIQADLLQIERWLPHQGHIGVFIHQNTLSAFEGQSFWDAVETSAVVRHAEPYMPHSWYVDALSKGRIRKQHCEEILSDLEKLSPFAGVYLAALQVPRLVTSDEAILSLIDLDDPSEEMEVLWEVTKLAVTKLKISEEIEKAVLTKKRGSLTKVDEILIQLAAVYLDNGVAHWPMPLRRRGFFRTVRKFIMQTDLAIPGPWKWFGAEARQLLEQFRDPVTIIAQIISKKSLDNLDRLNFLRTEALELAGWSGTFAALGHSKNLPHVKTSLAEFLAIQLLLKLSRPDRIEPRFDLSYDTKFAEKRLWLAREMQLVLSRMGITAMVAKTWSQENWVKFSDVLSDFGDVQRRRCLHQAYEKYFSHELLGAIKEYNSISTLQADSRVRNKTPELQAVFCIDEREESLRRQIEEHSPEFETFGAAGFFGVDMFFKGTNDHEPVPLCPPVIQPKHLIIEREIGEKNTTINLFDNFLHEGSRRLFGGAILAQVTGVFSVLPLALQVFFPGLGGAHLREPAPSELEFENSGKVTDKGLQIGYTVPEMVDRVEGMLKGMGLIKNFAGFVVMMGHGSQSMNNPHESAHDCGACGGRRGAPNARVFSRMANHIQVRSELVKRGIVIPPSTWFIGAYHDTCSDGVTFFDTHLVPPELHKKFEEHRAVFEHARTYNAAERCRRFSRGNLDAPKNALKHVGTRCADLREPRPEYGHATNAALVVGRRSLTQGLFLDRRSFLVSYDPNIDSDGQILGRILGAVIPVCSGISLEYYFSFVDNETYGCGTKLPHNVVGLLGVMNGATSDLRTGLPLQMVEIHEPMRLVVLVESTREAMSRLLRAQPNLARVIENEWIQMHILDHNSGLFYRRVKGEWSEFIMQSTPLARIPRSIAYTSGKAEHLSPIAVVGGV